MLEKVSRTAIVREDGYFYYVSGGAVWRKPKKGGKAEKLAESGLVIDEAYTYLLDSDGDIARKKKPAGGDSDDD